MELNFVPIPDPHIADYIVIAIFLCICMGIGVYYGYQTNKKPTLENYFLGNRRLLLLPVSMSLFVTFMSAISLMGVPAEVYVYGIRGVYVVVANVLSAVIASVTVVPLLYPLRLTSTYEYLQLRFRSKGVRTLGTMIGMLQTVAYMGVTLYAPGLALQTVAGIPLWLSIVVIGLVGTIYTAIGGIKSVVWTDVFQFVMIFIGLAAVTIKGSILVGTRYSVVGIATEGRRLEFFNSLDHFGFPPFWILASPMSPRRTKQLYGAVAFWIYCPFAAGYYIILGYLGILLYSYYNILKWDPFQAGFLSNFNQLMPYFVLDVLRSLPGLSGICISCVFSGALSTLSSGINALAANTIEDILGDCIKNSKIVSQIFAAKIFVFVYGLVVIGLAYAINSMSGSINEMALSVFGACGGPLAGLFFLGGMVPKANWIGAIIGSMTALVFNMWLTVGSQMYGNKAVKLTQNPTSGCFPNNITTAMNNSSMYNYNITMNTTPYDVTGHSSMSPNSPVTPDEGFFLYNVSYVWYGFIGFFLTLIIGTVISLCTGGDRGEPVESRLIFPICRKVCGLESKYKYGVAEMEEKVWLPQTTDIIPGQRNMYPITPKDNEPPIHVQPNDDDGASPL